MKRFKFKHTPKVLVIMLLGTISAQAQNVGINTQTNGLFQRYYKIEPTINENLNATVRFHYLDEELNGTNENNALLWKSTNNGLSWTQVLPDARNTTENWIEKNSIDHFSWWSMGNSASALPLIINYFNSFCEGKGTTLVWKANFDTEIGTFVIEKSKDAIHWESVANVAPSYNQTDFYFQDSDKSKLYFRLKSVSPNGTASYSKILVTDCEVKSIKLLLYPNPTVEMASLKFDSPRSFDSFVQLSDIKGNIVLKQAVKVEKGENAIKLNVIGLQSGKYIVSLQDGKQKFIEKMIKK